MAVFLREFQRTRLGFGWTEKQVEELLGGPAQTRIDDVRRPPTRVFFSVKDDNEVVRVRTSSWWSGEDKPELIEVVFHNGLVIGKAFSAGDFTTWGRIKRRIERRIRALWPKH